MKKILIIEDNDVKARDLSQCLSSIFSIDKDIPIARSYQSGVKSLLNNEYDLIILDMTMNTFDVGKNETGGKPEAFAGKHVLDQMDRYDISTPVIVVTGFETFGSGAEMISLTQLNMQLENQYLTNFKGIVYYHASQSDWLVDLKDKALGVFKDSNA